MSLLRLQLLLQIGAAGGARTAAERGVQEVVVLGPAEEEDMRLLVAVRNRRNKRNSQVRGACTSPSRAIGGYRGSATSPLGGHRREQTSTAA